MKIMKQETHIPPSYFGNVHTHQPTKWERKCGSNFVDQIGKTGDTSSFSF